MFTLVTAKATALSIVFALTPLNAGHPNVEIDHDAPVITRDDIVIHAPLHRIWKIQTDVEAWPEWQPDVITVKKETRGPLRKGSRFRWSVEGLENITSTVKQVVPNRRIAWGGPAQGVTAVHLWTFTPTKDGVRVHTEESWSGEPVSANVAAMQKALDASLDTWLHNLKKKAEEED
ncbi:SRPBCC family protein [Nonomuraea africana]|uniref:Uncharacterized protein YndB with AHSA1/START domain n=1 Tax=Nonomuraea africana TaxID=46171 RepID=A0ABR9K6P3_9ACTN|nr:SRPBCC family protein [Nonomuraea africana]MBE1557471.1 uncharacterized protein YndB with AHSA1/START domain [Nonomuraea africana]